MNEIGLVGLLIVISVVMVLYSLFSNKDGIKDQVLRRLTSKKGSKDGVQSKGREKRSTAKEVLEKVAPIAMKPVMPKSDEEMTTLRCKLAQGGFRHESAVRYFLASKTLVGLSLALLTFVFMWGRGKEPLQLASFVLFACGVGFMLPNAWLILAKSQRMEKIRDGLPDSLDLLVVSVESGLALDAGLQRVGEEMSNVHPELSEEMMIATWEAQMGVPRAEALENLALRTGVAEMRALVAVITQAERFGTSVAKALRAQANSLRSKRRLRAEERAQKTAVKLMLPLILFIFPSIFVVLVGPAGLKIAKTLGAGGPLSG
ncbi:MAG: type II secretion system F family protein [Planctomycetota bacterium]|jgi:tight adherence protein C